MRLSVDTDSWEVTLGRAGQHDRKASGSYYTPTELVERILDWTLDPAINEALSGDEPESALLDLKILDPACGSGHFLTAAADRVGFALATLRCAQSNPAAGEIERARRDVVQNCIYGVDIDPIAVELCKFALSPGSDDQRIRCGNSLLGLTPKMLAEGDHNTTHTGDSSAFHWHLEFPDVFKDGQANPATGWLGGFDVVIGNPPFLNQLETTTAQSKELATFLKRRYPGVAKGYADTAVIFAELSSQVVRAEGGRFGLVQPASILASADTKGARRSLTNRGTLETLWAAREGVFDASVRTCAIVFRNGEEPSTTELRRFTGLDFHALVPLRTNTDEIAGMETWAPLIADGFGIPRVDLEREPDHERRAQRHRRLQRSVLRTRRIRRRRQRSSSRRRQHRSVDHNRPHRPCRTPLGQPVNQVQQDRLHSTARRPQPAAIRKRTRRLGSEPSSSETAARDPNTRHRSSR